MTKAIIMNTQTGAVSEYDGFAFHSITPTHAGSALGLYTLGGNLDVATPIVSTVMTGKVHWGTTLKKLLDMVYFALRSSGVSAMTVVGATASYSYPITVLTPGVSRSKPGRGIRENYLAFGYTNTDGADFQLDRIEVASGESTNRRV